MKVTVTKEFASPEEAATWLRIFGGAPAVSADIPPVVAGEQPAPTSPAAPATTEKPKRKPRSDAGQPRGPYKLTPEEQERALKAAEANKEDDAVRQRLQDERDAAAKPAESAAPAASKPSATSAQAPEVASTPAAAAADPTMEDARTALGLINSEPGMGMPACMAHLADFGVNRISALPKEKFADFIKRAKEKVAEHQAAKK